MSIYKKAKKILDNDNISIKAITGNAVYFDVKVNDKLYDVYYLTRLNKWNCSCKWFSIRTKDCSHIISAEVYLVGYLKTKQ